MEARQPAPSEPGPGQDDDRLVQALREGDEQAFAELVARTTPAMLAVARGYVPSRTIAEEVVQETWLAVLTGLDRFEGRSSLRTWTFGILLNIAKTKGMRERRSIPFSSAFPESESGPTVDPSRFRPEGEQWQGHWASPPRARDLPEAALLSREVRVRLRSALDSLPVRQRTVVELRDVQGLDSDEVCGVLGIEPGNQRVLLHRGRAKLRQALDDYLDEGRA